MITNSFIDYLIERHSNKTKKKTQIYITKNLSLYTQQLKSYIQKA